MDTAPAQRAAKGEACADVVADAGPAVSGNPTAVNTAAAPATKLPIRRNLRTRGAQHTLLQALICVTGCQER